MESNDLNTYRRLLSRRDFTRKTLLAFAAAGATGLIGYGVFNTEKIRAISNVRRMGHCAPGIMQTLLDTNDIKNTNMVLYAGAMAGGIAGPEMECGVLTAPLMFIGFRNNNLTAISEKLDLITKAQSYVNEFTAFNGASVCGLIRNGGMPACMKTIRNFNKPFSKAVKTPVLLSDEVQESYTLLMNTFADNKFHCAHNVFNHLDSNFMITNELLDSSWIFIGGIALLNRTCGALTAGVLALSSNTAEIENSYLRVARMNRLLRNGDNKAMNEEINNFNRAINYSEELGSWFRNEFGSVSCHDIWKFNFSHKKDVEKYISSQCMLQCAHIAKKVAQKVNMMI
jgi:hypothetical protein